MQSIESPDDKPTLTEEAGYEALRGHVLEKALVARKKYGPEMDLAAMEALLADSDLVRFPTQIAFDPQFLLAGEFAWPRCNGERPGDGFTLYVHPHFQNRHRDLPYLIAYHIVAINYLDVATNEEAELFGAALFGMEVEEYYEKICGLADELGGPAGLR